MDESGGYTEYQFVAELYDHVGPYRSREDVSFYVDMAIASKGKVLEVGCGTGRVLIPIARAGIDITGLDLSPAMLDICRTKLLDETEEVRTRIKLLHTDMRDFMLEDRFSLAIIPFRPFQHLLTVEDQLSCLGSIWRHLIDEGVFILDIFNPSLPHLTEDSYLSEGGEEPEFQMPDGRVVVRRHQTISRDLFNQINDNELIYYVTHPDGTEERLVHRFKMRYLFRFEAEHLLARAGYEVIDVFADYDRSLHESKYPGELIIVARKMSTRPS
ncbi:MAG: class I SAM-dependent methyltransferase [Anaerolineales bacterium]|nr:MAG: class I SAM-dependent methyltransferase [Anaerolineales bacterium]